jgi:hypothetical protein
LHLKEEDANNSIALDVYNILSLVPSGINKEDLTHLWGVVGH